MLGLQQDAEHSNGLKPTCSMRQRLSSTEVSATTITTETMPRARRDYLPAFVRSRSECPVLRGRAERQKSRGLPDPQRRRGRSLRARTRRTPVPTGRRPVSAESFRSRLAVSESQQEIKGKPSVRSNVRKQRGIPSDWRSSAILQKSAARRSLEYHGARR